MKKLMMVAACACTVFCAAAEDVIVLAGESVVLKSGTYDKVFVNGTCTIPDNATVSCASLMVASGDVQNVVFTIGTNVTLNVTTASKTEFGYDNGAGTFTIGTNSHMTVVGNMSICHRIDATRVSQHMLTLNLLKGAILAGSGTDASFDVDLTTAPKAKIKTPEGTLIGNLKVTTTVNLDEGSELRFSSVRVKNRPDTRINFNGGRIYNIWNTGKTAMLCNNSGYSSSIDHGTKLYLTSVGGHPIRFHKANHAHYFMTQNDNGGTYFEGDIELNGISDDGSGKNNGLFNGSNTSRYHFNDNEKLPTTKVWFKGNVRPKFLYANVFPSDVTFFVEKGARVDLNDFDQTVAAIQGEGCVTNSGTADGVVPKLTVDGASDSSIGIVYPKVDLVKKGSGGLSVASINDAAASIDLQAGAFSVANMGAFGTLALDASAATANLGALAANAAGTLALTNYVVGEAPSKLPIAYASVADRSALKTWTVTLDGEPYTVLPLTAHKGWLWLGQLGLVLFVE